MDGRKNFRLGSFDLKSEVVVPCLGVKNDLRTSNPHPPSMPIISPNTFNKNFDIAIGVTYKYRKGCCICFKGISLEMI